MLEWLDHLLDPVEPKIQLSFMELIVLDQCMQHFPCRACCADVNHVDKGQR